MNRTQAAKFLGVSLRSLDRLCANGRLSKGRALLKTRPIVVFDPKELEALKGELTSPRPAVTENLPRSDTVGFRLDGHYISRLAEESAKHNMSCGEYARTLVIHGLEVGSQDAASEVRALRRQLSQFYVLLLTKGYKLKDSEAERIIGDLFGSVG